MEQTKLQYNHISGKPYEGNNQVQLLLVKQKNNYKSNAWLTFLQAKEKGLKIKKGSKSVSVFKGFNTITEKDEDGKIKTSSAPLGSANVFNLDQTEPFEK